jgi:predicted nucleic-acid-binding Zn-ribbon protein
VSESEVKNCPKCGGDMERGKSLTELTRFWVDSVHLAKRGDLRGDKIIPFYCKSCGYIELYKTPPHGPPSFLKNCVECGKEIPLASEECPYCGTKQPEYEES